MLKLNAGLSRKVGEPDFSSRGASVNLELEVEGHLIQDPDGLHDRIRKLFALVRQSVDEELSGHRSAAPSTPRGSATAPPSNGQSRQRRATSAQIKAIASIAERLEIDPDDVAQKRFGSAVDGLSLKDASALIDELKARGNGAAVAPGRSR